MVSHGKPCPRNFYLIRGSWPIGNFLEGSMPDNLLHHEVADKNHNENRMLHPIESQSLLNVTLWKVTPYKMFQAIDLIECYSPWTVAPY